MTVDAILVADCDTIRITRGTGYHVGSEDNWENVLVDILKGRGITNVKIEDHGYYKFHGKNFDVKHKLSSSTLPHTRGTPVDREILLARQWHLEQGFPLPQVLIRSHVHYYKPAGDKDCVAFSTPALQGLGDEFGEQQCSGTVHFGFVSVDVYHDGFIQPRPYIMEGRKEWTQPEVL
jgi:hypothetical protein